MSLQDRDYWRENYDKNTKKEPDLKKTRFNENGELYIDEISHGSNPSRSFWLYFVFVVLLLSLLTSIFSDLYTSKDISSAAPGSSVYSSNPLPLPATSIFSSTFPIETALSPFAIFASDDGYNYYFKLKDGSNGAVVLSGFVRAGTVFNTKVPAGYYFFEYAAGKDWFGTSKLFGDFTQINRSYEPLYFRSSIGYTIKFDKTLLGNMPTRTLPKESF